MRYALASFFLLGCLPLIALADDKKNADENGLKQIVEEYQEAMGKHQQLLRDAEKANADAKTDAEKEAAKTKLDNLRANTPRTKFADQFMDYAEKNAKKPEAVIALAFAAGNSKGKPGSPKSATWSKALQRLQDNWVDNPEIVQALPAIRNANDDGATKLLQTIVGKNPDRKVQAKALKTLIGDAKALVELAEEIKENPTARTEIDQFYGKAHVEKVIANVDRNRKERDDLTKSLHEKYADIAPDLSIGKTAPEVLSKDLDGKEVKLSALRGRVVVLDIWATWCGPCKAMIPHERELVKRMKDKPFTFVSISADDDKDELKEFIKKEPMPWTHWWNGPDNPMLETWDVQYFPTIYVLDAKGVIRFKDVREKDLDEAVERLVKEAEEKK